MTASKHLRTFTVGLNRLPILSGSLMKDETVIPYVQGDLTIPVTVENYTTLKALDPRTGPRGVLTMVQRFGESDPVSLISDQYRHINLVANPIPPATVSGNNVTGFAAYAVGTGEAGATTVVTGATDGPDGITTYARRTVTTPKTAGSTGWQATSSVWRAPIAGASGDVVTGSVWVRINTPAGTADVHRTARLRVQSYSASAAVTTSDTATAVMPLNEWVRLDVSMTATGDFLTVGWWVYQTGGQNLPAGSMFDVTAVQLQRGPLTGFSTSKGTAADLTAAWDNWTAKNVSDTYGRPYNDFGMKPSTKLTASLGIREVNIDFNTWTATVRLASDEARLMDTINTDTVDRVPDDSTVREAVQMVLGYIGSFLQLDDGADHNFRSDAGGWAPGQSAWSYVQPLVESAGLRLYCDETGRWHLVEQETSSTNVTRLQSSQVSSMSTRTDREGDWYDAVMIEYRWRDVSDVEHVVYDYAATTENPTRPRFIQRDRVWPGNGAAASILRRDVLSGSRTQVSTVADYSVSTDGTLTVSFTSLGEVLAGDIQSVQWFFDDDRMTVIAKDSTTDVNPTSWLIAPEGYPWANVPAGIDWTEAGVLVETEA